jgi:hypothetical protein
MPAAVITAAFAIWAIVYSPVIRIIIRDGMPSDLIFGGNRINCDPGTVAEINSTKIKDNGSAHDLST